MLRSLKELTGYTVEATDGDVGKAKDFYFDDAGWFLRYVVVDTGGWLTGRKVLVGPEVFGPADWDLHKIPVTVSKDTIESSPPISEDVPVSRHEEERMRTFYGWFNWWTDPTYGFANASPEAAAAARELTATVTATVTDPHLRSVDEILGYHIEAKDGELGHVDDFIVDDRTWAIRYVVVATRNLLPGKKTLIAPEWISALHWSNERLAVDLTQQQIKNAPEFDPRAAINRRFEEHVYDYYGRPRYW